MTDHPADAFDVSLKAASGTRVVDPRDPVARVLKRLLG